MSGILARLVDEFTHPRRGITVRSASAEFGAPFGQRHRMAIASLSDADLIAMSHEQLVAYVIAFEKRLARRKAGVR